MHPPALMLETILLVTLGVTAAQNNGVVSYGDLAIGRTFTASSTCGLDGPKTFCSIELPDNSTEEDDGNGGRGCFICDSSDPANSHPASFLSDLDSSAMPLRTWWQAENGVGDVTLELELEALFFFTHLVASFRLPRPAAAVIERSRDFGVTYEPYQYYSNDCEGDFGMPDRSSVRTVDEVICTSAYSSLQPLTNGELVYQVLPAFLGINDYNTPEIIDKITLTNLRIRLLRLNTLPGDGITDQSTAQSYQYAIYSIVVRGWCFCNGHAAACDPPPGITQMLPGMVNSECRCSGNTAGVNCEQCQPLFNDRPWLPANGPTPTPDTTRECKECQCYGRASSCHFDPQVAMETGGSGGVCDNCTHRTTGRQCDQCVAGFYRNTSTLLSDPNLCIPCQCDPAGSVNNSTCYPDDDLNDLLILSGMCKCRRNVEGSLCNRCKPGFFNLSADNPDGCQSCECDAMGSEVTECHMTTGECTCKSHVTGSTCNTCEPGYCCLGEEGCVACDCHPGGSVTPHCNPGNGSCDCRSGVTGEKCDSVDAGQFVVNGLTLREMRKLSINGDFAIWLKINADDYRNVAVITFDLTYSPAEVDIPSPKPPFCAGSDSQVTRGTIPFREASLTQDMESGQYYVRVMAGMCWSTDSVTIPYQLIVNDVVQHPDNVIVSSLPSALALLEARQKEREEGEVEEEGDVGEGEAVLVRIEECFPIPPHSDVSDDCRDLALSVTALQVDGTLVCACDGEGAVDVECNEVNGQCPCAPGVEGRICDICSSGFFSLSSSGCLECDCDPAGSRSPICNTTTGQCDCLEGIGGLKCDRCGPDLFFSVQDGECVPCDCNEQGSSSLQCGRDGQCACKPGVRGLHCDECRPDHFNFSSAGCEPCDCYPPASVRDDGVCDGVTGECECVEGVMGRRCDSCPAHSVGPDLNMAAPCTDCFCNGYSRRCSTDEGWYQARVASGGFRDSSGGSMDGFRSNGNIFSNRGCLEINPLRSTLSISLPKAFLGDKRTSYNQHLTFNLSLPHALPGNGYRVLVEVVGHLSNYHRAKLVAELPLPGNEPQLIELRLSPGVRVQVDLWFWKRLASQRDIRQILADIRQLRLKVIFDRGTPPTTAVLCGVSLDYATDDTSDPFAVLPLKPVNYVERCTCPPNREGPRCGKCSPGYTTDPSLGGEFARCVRCFCNFHSDSCDPSTGECFNCSDNTEGRDCERCMSGYFRNTSLTIDGCIQCECSEMGTVGGVCTSETGVCECRDGFTGVRCDECSEGYWSPTPGQCIACDCDEQGSSSVACQQESGVCTCLPNVVGDKCDRCQGNSTEFFPSCEACGECTGQWQGQINPLRTEVDATLELIRVTTVTVTPEEVPLLNQLLSVLSEVREILGESRIDSDLAGNVTTLHDRLCRLTNQTRDLFERAVAVSNEITRLDAGVNAFENATLRLATLLGRLQSELEQLSAEFGNLTALDLSPDSYLALALEAEERSAVADQLISRNVSGLITITERILASYSQRITESEFLRRQMENLRLLSDLSQHVSEYEAFLTEASSKLCGSGLNDPDGTCGVCGGVECDTCGGSPGCNSLVTMAGESLNVSRRALEVAGGLRNETLARVAQLRLLLTEISSLRNDSLDAESAARDVHTRARDLDQRVRDLLETLRQQLVEDRINPDTIEEVENETLSLKLKLNQDEFLELLVTINATIDRIFGQFGVNSTDLLKRAENALSRAQNTNLLAVELAANVSVLELELQDLQRQGESIQNNLTLAEDTNSDTVVVVTETSSSLDQTSSTLNTTQETLTNISQRLGQLESQVAENLALLAIARSRTEEVERASTAINQSSMELEASYALLRNATDEKIRLSRDQLLEAERYRERTAALIERTSQQLLLEENLERTETALLAEQEVIRGNVQRLSLQLEELNELIQVHIARNTACLDSGSLQKR